MRCRPPLEFVAVDGDDVARNQGWKKKEKKPPSLTTLLGRRQGPRHRPQQGVRVRAIHKRRRCAESHLGHEQHRVGPPFPQPALAPPRQQHRSINQLPSHVLTQHLRFDGRQIRVDKASDTGPKGGGRGGAPNNYARGGFAAMPLAAPQAVPGIAYGSQQPYGMPPNMYHQPYGRGYAPAAPAGYAVPPQGM